jgi:eukaryotic-like serine/threonine-protein kinase
MFEREVVQRCPHCGLQHASNRTACPATGLPLGGGERRDRRAAAEGLKTRARRGMRDLVGLTIDGKYHVVGLIGQGGMGTVYEAQHLRIGRLVAVKVLRPEHLERRESISRFEHEARVVGAIRHPNICQIFDIGRLPDGSPFLVMERLRGKTLSERIEKDGPVPWQALCKIMGQVLEALDAAHQRGIIHRDFKPDNIFLTDGNQEAVAKVLDFGISKSTGTDSEHNPRLTKTGMVMGTPYYMAPEQAMGERGLDARVDVWAAGVVTYEALTGARPFVARNYNALLVQILTGLPRPLEEVRADIPESVRRVVACALEKKRELRIPSALELRNQLLACVARENPPPVRTTSRTPRARGRVAPRREWTDVEEWSSNGDEEVTVVLTREEMQRVDEDLTEVDPPGFLHESDSGTITERRRR